LITKFSVYGRSINSLTGDDVRVSERLRLPRKKLKGFVSGQIGPVDDSDFVGGNFAASLNFSSTLPMFLQGVENTDLKFFIDAGNVWGVDYSSTIGDSNHLRSSTGITAEWFTPIGPLSFSLSQAISKIDTDKTESFQFNLGTTF